MSKLTLALFVVALVALVALSEAGVRVRRDVICGVRGHRGCSMYCRMRGHRDGACAWDTESGANDCHCDTELRGIRCNVGGGTVCHMSCVLMGYSEGSCGADFNCNCSGTTRWGNVIETVQNRV